jgi:hypothetical protein
MKSEPRKRDVRMQQILGWDDRLPLARDERWRVLLSGFPARQPDPKTMPVLYGFNCQGQIRPMR